MNLKKTTALLAAFILLICTASCTSTENNKDDKKDNDHNIEGEYVDLDLEFTVGCCGLTQEIINRLPKDKFIANEPSKGTLETKFYDYKWSVNDDTLTLEVTKDKSPPPKLMDNTGKKTDYIIYKDYLISTDSPEFEIVYGDVNMSEGKLDIAYEYFNDIVPDMIKYRSLQFDSEENYCEMEGYDTCDGKTLYDFYFEGTYKTEGNIVILEMDYCETSSKEREAGGTFYFYIANDGELLTDLYMKVS